VLNDTELFESGLRFRYVFDALEPGDALVLGSYIGDKVESALEIVGNGFRKLQVWVILRE
jgi:hypothetical protein